MLHDVSIKSVYRDPLFDRTLEELRSKGGYGAVAAGKADAFLAVLCGGAGAGVRDNFRFTRKGEYRIRNCRKVDLGCGYRIVCIQKDQRLVLLYIGTHDDCFRWIERHRTAEYDLDAVTSDAWIPTAEPERTRRRPDAMDADKDRLTEAYEEELMKRIDDGILRKVFAGLAEGRV